jgi:SNF2 family DNA or RNA helicase
MPIDLDVTPDGSKLIVWLVDPRFTNQMNLLLSSLLTSQLDRVHDQWLVTWSDFKQLRVKMDQLGLTEGRSATQAAVSWIADQEARDVEVESIKEGKQNHLVHLPKTVVTKPYEDQITGIRFLTAIPFAVLADEMGIGKTLQILSAFAVLKSKGEAKHMLVIAPNSVKTGWVKEVNKHTTLTVSALGNGSVQLEQDFDKYKKKRTDVLVVHYDALSSTKTKHNRRRLPYSHLVEEALKLPWDFIVFDEAHQVKSLETKRGQASLHLAANAKTDKKTRARLCLATGTPVSESPMDAWSVLNFIDKSQLPKTYNKFENYFTIKVRKEMGGRVWGETTGYKNLGELKQLLQRSMIRRLKVDIKGMPEKVSQFRYLQMTGAQQQLYNDIKRGLYDTIEQDPNNKLSIAFAMTKCIRLRQALNHPSLVEKEGESAKYQIVDEILDEVLTDPMSKVVLWTEFRAAADLLVERYEKKYGCIKLVGGTSQEQLSYWSKNFDHMPQRVAVGIPLFGGTGVDFLSRCRTAIYLEPPYSLITFRQSCDRIHRRVGTGNDPIEVIKRSPANLIFLQVEKSIDELCYKLLARKGDMVDLLLTSDEKLEQMGKTELLEYLK